MELEKAKAIAEELAEEVCSHCGQPLVELLWSKSVPGQRIYILT